MIEEMPLSAGGDGFWYKYEARILDFGSAHSRTVELQSIWQ